MCSRLVVKTKNLLRVYTNIFLSLTSTKTPYLATKNTRSFGNFSQSTNICLKHQAGVLQTILKTPTTCQVTRVKRRNYLHFSMIARIYCQLNCCGSCDFVALYLISRSDTPSSHWCCYTMWVPRDERNELWLVEGTCWSCTYSDRSYLEIPGTNSRAKCCDRLLWTEAYLVFCKIRLE